MPLFVSTRSLAAPADLAGMLEIFRLASLDRVAIEDGPLLVPDDPGRLAAFTLAAHGTFLPSEEPFGPNLAAGDEDYRRRSVRRLEEHLAFCAERGIPRYTFLAGYALEETHDPAVPSRVVSANRARDQLLKSLDRLAEFADARGVALGLMNGDARRAEMLGCEASELAGILDTLQIPFLGLRLDVGHLLLAARRRGFEVEEFAAVLRGRVVGLRLHEVSKADGAHRLPVPEGPVEELLASHPEWHELPMVLDARGVDLGRLMDAKERLESRLAMPVQGPSPA